MFNIVGSILQAKKMGARIRQRRQLQSFVDKKAPLDVLDMPGEFAFLDVHELPDASDPLACIAFSEDILKKHIEDLTLSDCFYNYYIMLQDFLEALESKDDLSMQTLKGYLPYLDALRNHLEKRLASIASPLRGRVADYLLRAFFNRISTGNFFAAISAYLAFYLVRIEAVLHLLAKESLLQSIQFYAETKAEVFADTTIPRKEIEGAIKVVAETQEEILCEMQNWEYFITQLHELYPKNNDAIAAFLLICDWYQEVELCFETVENPDIKNQSSATVELVANTQSILGEYTSSPVRMHLSRTYSHQS